MSSLIARTPRRIAGLFGGAAAAVLCVAGSAFAIPAIVERVPANAAVTVVVPNIESVEKDLQGLATSFGLPAAQMNLDAILAQVGISGAVSKTGALAVFMMNPGDAGEPSPMVLFEAADFDKLAKDLGGTVKDGTINAEVNGEPIAIKKLEGKLVVAGADGKAIAAFKGDAASKDAFKKLLGTQGDALTDKAKLSIIINFDAIRPELEQGVDSAIEAMEMNLPIDPETAAPLTKFVRYMGETFTTQTKSVVLGLGMDSLGISLDAVAQFNAESKLAKATATPGKSTGLLRKLPNIPYLAAFALDMSSPDLRAFAEEFIKEGAKASKAAQSMAEAQGMPVKKDAPAIDAAAEFHKMFENVDGAATIVGVSPAGLMGGLMTRSVTFTSGKDSAKVLSGIKRTMDDMKDRDMADVTYAENAVDVAGGKADSYEMKLKDDGENAMAARIGAMIYGASGGPSGYIYKADGGVIQTYAKSSDLLESAVKASGGEGGFGGEKVTAGVAEKLPGGRVAEIYIGIKGLLDSAAPMAAMALPNFRLDVPDNLPPIALSLAPKDGSIQATIYAPAKTVKVLADVAKQVQAAMNGGAEEDDDAAPGAKPGEPGAKKPADAPAKKKPKF